MRGRLLTLIVLVAIAVGVVASFRSEERFVVEDSRLAREPGGVRVVGTLFNAGPAAEQVIVDVAVVSREGHLGEKESLRLGPMAAGARLPFSSGLYPEDIRTYSIQVGEGRNPYGN
jgi:hypothetical protein